MGHRVRRGGRQRLPGQPPPLPARLQRGLQRHAREDVQQQRAGGGHAQAGRGGLYHWRPALSIYKIIKYIKS